MLLARHTSLTGNCRLNDLIGILIFSSISAPLLTVPPEFYKKPFMVGSILMTIATFSIFIWALAKEGGGGPLLRHPNMFSGAAPLSGSQLGWAMVYGVSSTIGSISAGILNQSDYTRFATHPRAQIVTRRRPRQHRDRLVLWSHRDKLRGRFLS